MRIFIYIGFDILLIAQSSLFIYDAPHDRDSALPQLARESLADLALRDVAVLDLGHRFASIRSGLGYLAPQACEKAAPGRAQRIFAALDEALLQSRIARLERREFFATH
jgi:hypothetical protein